VTRNESLKGADFHKKSHLVYLPNNPVNDLSLEWLQDDRRVFDHEFGHPRSGLDGPGRDVEDSQDGDDVSESASASALDIFVELVMEVPFCAWTEEGGMEIDRMREFFLVDR